MAGRGRNQPGRPDRPPIPFRAVNVPGRPGYVAGLQRHHLIPQALHGQPCFLRLLAGLDRAALDDFRHTGMLWPASETGAARMGLPLHRGPHRDYTAMVRERLGEIEHAWSRSRLREPVVVAIHALQATLRRELLAPSRSICLNCRDPWGTRVNFAQLDAMAETLWGATQSANAPVSLASAAIAA